MQPRDWKVRIDDILDAVSRVLDYTAGMDFASFSADRKTIDAVVWNFQVIGEASRHVPAEIQNRYPGIPWVRMRGMRNVMVHDYPSISTSILWDTIHRNLPGLIPLLREVLEKEP